MESVVVAVVLTNVMFEMPVLIGHVGLVWKYPSDDRP